MKSPWSRWRTQGAWWLAWALVSAMGAAVIARSGLLQLRDDFEVNGRIAHRLMSQQVVQFDAVLATLALLETTPGAGRPEQRLPAVYPSILSVQRREPDSAWPDEALQQAEARSRERHRPEMATRDFSNGRYRLVMASTPISYMLDIDLASAVPWRDWPMDPKTSPMRVTLERDGRQWVLQPGDDERHSPWQFDFRKTLASESQAFDLVAQQTVAWSELPWWRMLAWTLAMALLFGGAHALRRTRIARRRAEELLRLGQVARLNALGELAAGMAHELNQPLTAVLANTQAARRLLDDDPPALDTAREAMKKAADQARRAADVVARLRRVIERPDREAEAKPVALQEAVRAALHLLTPEFEKRGVQPGFEDANAGDGEPAIVSADPIALEQIVHNLLMNALQSLDDVPAESRTLTLSIGREQGKGRLTVSDTGRGIAPEVLPHLFEPFYSTRAGGLGLGLSLCETLASGMGGSLSAEPVAPRGARFVLMLPLEHSA